MPDWLGGTISQQIPEQDSDATVFKAQYGEDRLLAAHFENKPNGVYVELGAHDGVEFSNSYYFEKLGWSGVLIEPNPKMAAKCKQARPNSTVVSAAVVPPNSPAQVTLEVVEGAEYFSSLNFQPQMFYQQSSPRVSKISVPARTLDEILDECGIKKIDFMTVDVEGHELGVLQGFTISRFRPEIVIVERFNRTLIPAAAILKYMHRNHYVYRRSTGCNDWFYRADATACNDVGYQLSIYRPVFLTAWAKARHLAVVSLKALGLLDLAKTLAGRKKV